MAFAGDAPDSRKSGTAEAILQPGLKFSCLHGLRGLLALWVVLSHTSPGGFGVTRFPRYGSLAVDVFFVMSGFILMHTHHQDFGRMSAVSVGRFLSLRFWRTMPVQVLSVCVSLLISTYVFEFWPGTSRILKSIMFIDTWWVPMIGRGMNGPVWSLHFEWMGYLAFPWLCRWLLSLRSLPMVAILVLGVVTLETGLLVWDDAADMGTAGTTAAVSGLGAFVRMAGGFTLGCLMWVGFQYPGARLLAGDWQMLGAICAATMMLLLADAVWSLAILAAIVLLAVRPGPMTAAALEHPVVMFLGRISFSLYMVHYPIVRVFQFLQIRIGAGLPGGLFSAAAALSSLLLASLICVLAEEPLRRFGRSLTTAAFPLSAA